MQHLVYIGIGSNLGDRNANCVSALCKLKETDRVEIIASSKWRETRAVTADGETQPNYINGVVKIFTDLSPEDLLKRLKDIERELGRPREHKKWSLRTIDLDILFYDDIVLNSDDLVIPHPEIQKRIFVLEPLCDIEPKLLHPVLKRTVRQLYDVIASEAKQSHESPGIDSALRASQ
jgi:2-amino-4-hydroxy-6-hydroxymethyldihydropteridine diphosphokinase